MSARRVLPLIALAGLASALASAAPIPVPATRLLDEVKILSAPEMDGRASATPGGERAALHVATVLQEAGLRPADGHAYAMRFSIPTRVRLGNDNRLAFAGPDARTLVLNTDWTPVGASADGAVEGEVVFVGYGIAAPALHYDDYAGIDVRGKIVVALGGEPGHADPPSPFARAYGSGYGQRAHKARAAHDHGALALLYVPRPEAALDTLPPLRGGLGAGDLPSAAITRATVESLLGAGGQQLAELKARIDTTLAPASVALRGVRATLSVHLVREPGTTANIVGILPGTDPQLAREAVVIGAHYDHLGRDGEGSLDTAHRTDAHPGADDNASGTAAVLGLARAFAASGGTPRTLVFALFSGEEMGFLGAGAYVRHPPFPLERTIAMVNFDMVGRLRDNRLIVGGLDSGSGLEDIVTGATTGLGLEVELRGSPWAPSDHQSFYQHRVPVLFFHTGVHDDYHRTSDTWEKINAAGLERVVALAERVIDRLARGAAPAYATAGVERPELAAGAVQAGTAYFGIAPDPADDAPGARLAVVQPGTAAARAGAEPGDVVVRFGGVRVYTFEDLREAIVARKPGDAVDVIYLRDRAEHAARAVLGTRP